MFSSCFVYSLITWIPNSKMKKWNRKESVESPVTKPLPHPSVVAQGQSVYHTVALDLILVDNIPQDIQCTSRTHTTHSPHL